LRALKNKEFILNSPNVTGPTYPFFGKSPECIEQEHRVNG
jgi:hypothetical protein